MIVPLGLFPRASWRAAPVFFHDDVESLGQERKPKPIWRQQGQVSFY